MRALFLLFLLANLLVLAWTRWVDVRTPVAQVEAAGATEPLRPIRLQHEAPDATGAAGSATPPGAAAELAAAACVSVGPYETEAQANAAADSLRRMGFASRLRAASDEVRIGHWVRVANLATAVDADNAVAALRAAGLADAQAVTDAGAATVVSIGVYADAARAAAAAETVRRAGFEPQTVDRERTLDVFWLDVDRQANGGIPALEDAGTPVEGTLPLELRVCPSAPLPEPVTPSAESAAG